MEEQHQPTGFTHCWNGCIFIVRCLERDHASRLGGKRSQGRIGLQRRSLEFVFLDGCDGGSLRAMEYIGRDLAREGEGGMRSKAAGQVERSQASVPHVYGWMRIACVPNLDHADSFWGFKCIYVSLVSDRAQADHQRLDRRFASPISMAYYMGHPSGQVVSVGRIDFVDPMLDVRSLGDRAILLGD